MSFVWGKPGILPALRRQQQHKHCSQILPAVRPQRPAARDSGSSAVQQSHICFRRQPATLQLCDRGNLPKTTGRGPQRSKSDWRPQTCANCLFLVCFYSMHAHIFIRGAVLAVCPRFSVCNFLCVTETKRITVMLAAKSCLAGINRGTCKHKEDGTDVFCWSFLSSHWSDP